MLQYALHVHYRISKRFYVYGKGPAQSAAPRALHGIKTIVHILNKKTFPVITDGYPLEISRKI
jgi:hypothetical protein